MPPVFFIRKRSTVQNGPFCKLIFSGMRLRLVLTLEQATNKNVLSALFRCYRNFLILTCSPITGLHLLIVNNHYKSLIVNRGENRSLKTKMFLIVVSHERLILYVFLVTRNKYIFESITNSSVYVIL